MRRRLVTAITAALAGLVLPAPAALAASESTVEISTTSTGAQSAASSFGGSLSADGRLSVFMAVGDDIVPGDSNGWDDVFLHDEVTGATTRITTVPGGQPDRLSARPQISADGRWITYESYASNLVPGDTNNSVDVFLYEVATAKTTRISVPNNGNPAQTGGESPSISADGRYVAFLSSAHLAGRDTNGAADAFVYDRVKHTVTRVSVSTGGVEVNKVVSEVRISGNGRLVAFVTKASSLDPQDTNGIADLYVRDLAAKTTTRISAAPGGSPADDTSAWPRFSKDGRYLMFDSAASNLVPGDGDTQNDMFVFDLVSGARSKLPRGNAGSYAVSISDDGRYVGFDSSSTDLVPGDTNGVRDGFVLDRTTGSVERISLGASGGQLDTHLWNGPELSGDGHSALFDSRSADIVPGGSGQHVNAYVRHF